MEDKAAAVASEMCVKTGVCGEAVLETDIARKVVELFHPEKPWKGLIVEWLDGRITVCWKNSKDKKVHCCYTSSQPFEDGFYMAQAFYTEPGEKFGYRVRELHTEEKGSAAGLEEVIRGGY